MRHHVAARDAGKVSRLNCGFSPRAGNSPHVDDEPNPASVKSATNASIGRVECPMVKNGLDIDI